MTLYALTTFLGAFLLFLVQPLIGKYILPWFGGGPGVWTTCLLFFQTLLLGGYAYAHFTSTRLKPRTQALTHLTLLALSLAWLPIIPAVGWKPAAGDDPTLRIFLLLTATLGLPYLLLSATGPLLQRWFSLTHPGKSPYRLYALSNVASLLALVGYPLVIEPCLTRAAQAWGWSVALGCFAVLCGGCAWRFRRVRPTGSAPDLAATTDEHPTPPTLGQRFCWVAFPALASVLLVATTSKLCVDVAVIPFLWVLPLALYLLSFIICFDHERWYARGVFAALLVIASVLVCYFVSTGRHDPIARQIAGYSAALFVACMVCHGETYRLRPPARHLTNFYLHLAVGGALGGLFVAVMAPLVFPDHFEIEIGYWAVAALLAIIGLRQRNYALVRGVSAGTVIAAAVLPWVFLERAKAAGLFAQLGGLWDNCRTFYLDHRWWAAGLLVALLVSQRRLFRAPAGAWRWRFAALPLALVALLGTVFVLQIRSRNADVVEFARNFYGTLKVRRYPEPATSFHYHMLSHGITTHGMQFQRPLYDVWTTTYYGRKSGIGLVLQNAAPVEGGRNFGFVGLGVGTLAAYGLPGDRLRFYEINPAVPRLARTRFTYLARTAAADVQIVLGDARLSLENELAHGTAQQFDVLALDAFSSDAIPIHLLTQEAFAVYLRHLKPDGVIAVHVSNRYLNLQPVVAALAEHFHLHLVAISETPDKKHWWLYASNWVLLSRDPARFASADFLRAADKPAADAPTPVLWTDDRASLTGVLR